MTNQNILNWLVVIHQEPKYLERTTPIDSCNGVFIHFFIFRLKFPQIQSPTGALLTILNICIILMWTGI